MTDKKNTLYEDLLLAQKDIEKVDKDGKNPFFRSDYTTLNATIDACKKALNDHNIMVLQPIDSDENGVYVCTQLVHVSGDVVTSRMRIMPAKDSDPQAQGSAITYARRYALKSMLCMSDADDDAEKAMARPPAATTTAPKLPATTDSSLATPKQVEAIYKMMKHLGISQYEIEEKFGVAELESVSKSQASDIIKYLGDSQRSDAAPY